MFSTQSGAAKLALAVVLGLIVFKAAVAIITGSIGITAQAVDSFIDLFAVSLIGFAIREASRPADEEHPFGHGKLEGVAAAVQAVLILTAAGGIIYAALRRLATGTPIELAEAGIGVMLVSILASLLLSRHLLKVARATYSIALESSAHNIAADIYSAVGVLLALVAIRFTGINILDPIVALGMSVFILKAGYDVLKKSFGELVDVRLSQAEEAQLTSCIKEHAGQLAGFHEVRTRRAGSQRFVDLHLLMPKDISVEESHRMCDHLEKDIAGRLPNSSVTIHVEPCNMECQQCSVSSCSYRTDVTFGDRI